MIGFGHASTTNQPLKHQAKSLPSGREWIVSEAETSAIDLNLMLANVRWVEGQEAVEILTEQALSTAQRVNSYVTQPSKRILEHYEFAQAGCWVAYGITIYGTPDPVAYVKPISPRLDFEKKKKIKYETPKGLPATPILPHVDDKTVQNIFERFNVEPLIEESFWRTVWRCNLPIVITEGLKKALSLLTHGIPAIALRGVTCWHKKGSAELHDAIEQFVIAGKQMK